MSLIPRQSRVCAIGISFCGLFSCPARERAAPDETVVIETVFAWPGMGRFAVQAVFNRDFPVVQAAVFVGGFFFIVINFLTDLLYVYLDPRIRY